MLPVTDGEDEVNDGGELVELQVVPPGEARHALPELKLLFLSHVHAALDRVDARSLENTQ